MRKKSTMMLLSALCATSALVVSSNSYAQSRVPPAGSALAQTPPIDQRAKQVQALPRDQKKMYIDQAKAAKVRQQ